VKIFLGRPEFLLKSSHQFFFLAFLKEQIISWQVGRPLFQFPGSLLPVALHANRIHLIPFTFIKKGHVALYATLLPLMTLTKTAMIASTRSTWMKPPSV
jgi:hypothetical protein